MGTVIVDKGSTASVNQCAVSANTATNKAAEAVNARDEIKNTFNGSPRAVYASLAALQAAYPTGTTGIFVCTGSVAEVDTLTVTAGCTTAGNVTITLNGVAKTVALTVAMSTASLVATAIRGTTFSGWVTGGTDAVVTFTKTTVGACTAPVYAVGSTGAIGTITVNTAGVDADGKWYYWNGSAWVAGGMYQSTGITAESIFTSKLAESSVTPSKTNFINTGKNIFNKDKVTSGYAIYGSIDGMYAATGFSVSDYMFIRPSTQDTISHTHAYAFYDVDRNYISGVAYNASTGQQVTSCNTPVNAYFMRITIPNSALNMLQIEQGSTATAYESFRYLSEKLIVDYSQLKNMPNYALRSEAVKVMSLTYTYNNYVHITTGVVTSVASGNFGYAILTATKGSRFLIAGTYIDAAALYVFLNANNNVVTSYPSTSASQTTESVEFIAPCDGTLLIGRYLTDTTVSMLPILTLPSSLQEHEVDFLKGLVRNVLCIGDSITDGAYYDGGTYNGASVKENYPYMLAKISGWTVSKKSSSGYSASNWWVAYNSAVNYAQYDTVIICLGTNNGLTDTLSTDCVGTDYTAYATTETGYYAKIVASILATNPNCHIFLAKVFASKGDVTITNTAINAIATRWGCGIVDDTSLYGNTIYHPFGNAVHYGKIGNLFRANTFYKNILNYINTHLSSYEVLLDE